MNGNVPLYRDFARQTATIAQNATDSSVIRAGAHAFIGIALPAAFEGTSLSFKVSPTEDGTFQALYDDLGILVSLPVTQGRSYTLPVAISAWPFLKLVSSAAGGEDAAREIVVVAKG